MNRSYSDDYLKGFSSSNMFTFGSKDHSFVESGTVISYTASNCRIKVSEDYAEENNEHDAMTLRELLDCGAPLPDKSIWYNQIAAQLMWNSNRKFLDIIYEAGLMSDVDF